MQTLTVIDELEWLLVLKTKLNSIRDKLLLDGVDEKTPLGKDLLLLQLLINNREEAIDPKGDIAEKLKYRVAAKKRQEWAAREGF